MSIRKVPCTSREPRTVNKAHKRKNSEEQFKNCKNFCFRRQLQVQMAGTYV